MRIVEPSTLTARPVDAFGSEGFSMAGLSRDAQVALAHVATGGCIGEHPAVVDQLLLVAHGRARVSGGGDTAGTAATAEIGPGQAALWTGGEVHATVALEDLLVVIVEADGLDDRLSELGA